jgi:hypothetical protein
MSQQSFLTERFAEIHHWWTRWSKSKIDCCFPAERKIHKFNRLHLLMVRYYDLRGGSSSSTTARSSNKMDCQEHDQQQHNDSSSKNSHNMSISTQQFPGKRTFRREESSEDADDELGRSLKRIRLDGSSSSNSSSSTNLHAAAVQSQQQQHQQHPRRPTPGELCVRRDIGDSLVNGQLQIITSQADMYLYGPNATLRQIEPNRFLFTFAATAAGVVVLVNQQANSGQQQQPGGLYHQTANIGSGSGVVTISISIPKRYPHHPPSLTIVPGSSFLFPRTGHNVSNIVVEQQRLVNLILTRPHSSNYVGISPGHHHHHQHQQQQYLWSPVHRLTDVLDWILHDYTVVATTTRTTARCDEPRIIIVPDHSEPPPQQQQQQHQHSQLRMEHSRFRK